MVEQFPEIMEEEYLLTEKIDGANIQLIFIPNQQMKLGKRSGLIEEGEKFFDIFNVMNKYQKEVEIIQKLVDHSQKSLRIYGEIFGKGVIRRINYGEEKYIRFFDCVQSDQLSTNVENEEFLSQKEFIDFLAKLELSHMFVPIITKLQGLKRALNYDLSSITSSFNKELALPVEGFVIKPYNKIFQVDEQDLFYLKKKNIKFLENELKKKGKPKLKDSDEIVDLREKFQNYLNENRLLGLISKFGPISSKKEIGKYISLLIEDAKQDFEKDFTNIVNIEKNQLKRIIRPDLNTINLIKKYVGM